MRKKGDVSDSYITLANFFLHNLSISMVYKGWSEKEKISQLWEKML